MPRQLNVGVMASQFNAGDIKKAEAYAEEAEKSLIAPAAQAPTCWVRSWTYASVASYRYCYYNDYRNCVYYHLYCGRYWR